MRLYFAAHLLLQTILSFLSSGLIGFGHTLHFLFAIAPPDSKFRELTTL